MITSIHPMVDQLVQWMDGQVCKKEKIHLKIPIEVRLYAALRASRYRLGFIRKKDIEAGIEYWNPTDELLDPMHAARFGRKRHLLLMGKGYTFESKLSKYFGSLGSRMTDHFLDRCF